MTLHDPTPELDDDEEYDVTPAYYPSDFEDTARMVRGIGWGLLWSVGGPLVVRRHGGCGGGVGAGRVLGRGRGRVRDRHGSVLVSADAEKLAQIAALCDECDSFSDTFTGETFSIRKVRAILAKPGLALVRPVEGVTVTPEDCQRVLSWYRSAEVHWDATEKADRALAARLEASS